MKKLVSVLIALAVVALSVPSFADTVTKFKGGVKDIMTSPLQVSDNDPGKMNAVLNVAADVSKYYSENGDEVEIQIVAFNAGLTMLRADKSPVVERLKSFKQGMPNVSFIACENTLDSLTRAEGKETPLVDNAKRITAGVVTLVELGEKGWTIVRP